MDSKSNSELYKIIAQHLPMEEYPALDELFQRIEDDSYCEILDPSIPSYAPLGPPTAAERRAFCARLLESNCEDDDKVCAKKRKHDNDDGVDQDKRDGKRAKACYPELVIVTMLDHESQPVSYKAEFAKVNPDVLRDLDTITVLEYVPNVSTPDDLDVEAWKEGEDAYNRITAENYTADEMKDGNPPYDRLKKEARAIVVDGQVQTPWEKMDEVYRFALDGASVIYLVPSGPQ
jgi:hypothetical protein